MVKKLGLHLLILAALLAASLPGAQAAPPAQSTNLLVNGGFESTGGLAGTASWTPWWAEIQKPADGAFNYAYRPTWNAESLSNAAAPALILAGSTSQRIINNWDPWWAGVRQVVNAPAGARVRLTAYARVWASAGNWPNPSDITVGTSNRVGLDPNGSENQFASTVVWSGSLNPHDAWQPVSVEATVGASGKVGVFLSSDYRGSSRQFLSAYWDEASLVVVSAGNTPPPGATNPPGATSPPQPTSPPAAITPFVLPTPGPDGNIIYVVQPGDTLWRIASLSGKTIDEIKAMNGLTSDIISIGQRLVIGQGAPSVAPTNTPDPNAATAAPTTNPAQPTATAASTQVAGAAGAGTVCALLWQDENGNGLRDGNEGSLANGTLTVVDVGTGAPVQAYTTTADDTRQHCFEGLLPGRYTISSAAPAGYNATTASSVSVEVQAGDVHTMEFGAQPGSETSPDGGASPSGSGTRLRTALFGSVGVVLLLLAAGVAGFLFLRRR